LTRAATNEQNDKFTCLFVSLYVSDTVRTIETKLKQNSYAAKTKRPAVKRFSGFSQ